MALIRYTARRSLRPGILAGTVHDFAVGWRRWDESRLFERRDTFAIGGARQSILDRVDTQIQLETTVHGPEEVLQLREFIDSVAGGETFEVSETSALLLFRVALLSSSIRLERVGQSRFRMGFSVRPIDSIPGFAEDIFSPLSYVWDCRDAASASPWIDRVAGYSLPWLPTAPANLTVNQSTAGLNATIIGSSRSNRAVRLVGGTEYTWRSNLSGDAALAQSAGSSIWVRMLGRRVDNQANNAPNNAYFELKDTVGTSTEVLRCFQTDSSNEIGGSAWYYNSSVSPVTATVSIAPTGSPWCLFDVFIAGATGAATMRVNGVGSTVAGTGATQAIEAPWIGLFDSPELDVIAVGLAFGASAEAYSSALHDADLARVTA